MTGDFAHASKDRIRIKPTRYDTHIFMIKILWLKKVTQAKMLSDLS
jgi:hypothetical protein